MVPMDPKRLINRFSWKRSPRHADMVGFRVHGHIWLVSAYTVTYGWFPRTRSHMVDFRVHGHVIIMKGQWQFCECTFQCYASKGCLHFP